jgi:hypothetical protein
VEEKNFLEKEYPQDFPFLIKSTEERRAIEQENKDTFKIKINSIGYHRLNVSLQNSANIQTNFQKLKLWNNHLKNLEEVTKAFEL